MNPNEFLESVEKKTNRLVEERGVAAVPHREVVKKILTFCQVKASQLKNGETITFTVPQQIVSPIDIVTDFEIKVTVTDASEDNSKNGSGSVELESPIGFTNGKFDKATININGYSYDGVLYDRTILSSLYHELNHLYDFWNDAKETNSLKRSVKSVGRAGTEVPCNVTSDSLINRLIETITYRLLSETERNALVANVYGDLQGIGSKRERFHIDVMQTKAYVNYLIISNNLRLLRNSILKEPNGIKNLRDYMKQCGIELNPYDESDNAYLKEYIRKVTHILKGLYKDIGRAASVYYDNIEFERPSKGKLTTGR